MQYDLSYDPPAPIIQVTIASPRNRRLRQNYSALLDTGADMTAIPDECVERMRLYPIRPRLFEDLSGNSQTLFTYKVSVTVGSIVVPQIEVVLTGLDFVVIGRDILNRFNLYLYGPQQRFELEE